MLEAVVSTQSTGGHSENWDLHSMLQIFITFIFSVSVGSTFLSTQSTDTNHRFSIVSPEVPFCTLSWTPMGECVAFNFSCVKYGGWIGLGFSNEQGKMLGTEVVLGGLDHGIKEYVLRGKRIADFFEVDLGIENASSLIQDNTTTIIFSKYV
eukprot:TRINITY_DN6931_c0_g2_i4.p1 TRINITY_DN6931_c0_g2~~TRINITY_DN6931_c0_g2_i4.p1  ORF type:complete len:152 (+),score=35.32 TRINITY_DN6931_c0_g2_i4:17-472(+)